ncbi:MAG: hypothetical protein L6Q59_12540 [Ignavibacteriaceae bacterium]|nr:hypothetical protein [Ignavibacteriaceae bacterium]
MEKVIKSLAFWGWLIMPLLVIWDVFIGLEFFDVKKNSVNNYSIELLVGQITVFVIYFSLLIFTFSSINLEKDIIYKYIILSPKSVAFIGFNFASMIYFTLVLFIYAELLPGGIFVIGFFLLVYDVYKLIDLSIWIIQVSLPEKAIEQIISQSNLNELIKLENNINNSLVEFNKLRRQKAEYDLSIFFDLFPWHSKNEIVILSSVSGIVQNVNWDKIQKLKDDLSKNNDYEISKVKLYRQPGDLVKQKEKILVFILKVSAEKGQERKIKNLSYYNNSVVELLPDKDFQNLITPFEDCLRILFQAHLSSSSGDEISLFDLLDKKLLSTFKKRKKWKEKGFYIRDFVYEFITSEISSQITSQPPENIGKIFNLIYDHRKLVLDNYNLTLIRRSLDFLKDLNYKYLNGDHLYHHHLIVMVLRVKELSIQSLFLLKKLTAKEVIADKKTYQEVIEYASNVSLEIFNSIIKYSYKLKTIEAEEILIENMQEYIRFLDVIDFISGPTEELKGFKKFQNNTIQYHSKNIITTSALVFRKIEVGELGPNLYLSIVVPSLLNCHNIGKWRNGFENFIIQYISELPTYLSDSQFADLFEEQRVYGAGSYVPTYYQFDKFWAVFLFYLFLKKDQYLEQLNSIKNLLKDIYKEIHEQTLKPEKLNMIEIMVREINNFPKDLLSQMLNVKESELNQLPVNFNQYMQN